MHRKPPVPAMETKSQHEKDKIESRYLVLDEPIPTFFHLYKKLTNISLHNEYDFIPMKIIGFDVIKKDKETCKYIRFDIKTKSGLKTNILIEYGNVNAEECYDAIVVLQYRRSC